MRKLLADLSVCFAAGVFGGFVNALLVWGLGESGITAAMSIKLAPDWTTAFLYPRLVWGGIWGLLFLLPAMQESVIKRGLIFGLFPTAYVLLYILPYELNQGMFGLKMGTLLPVYALLVNSGWGIASAWWVKFCKS